MSVQSQGGAVRSPFAEMAATSTAAKRACKPPRMPEDQAKTAGKAGAVGTETAECHASGYKEEEGEEALDSPVSGLVESAVGAQVHPPPAGILKEEGSMRYGEMTMKRTVSWADFTAEDPSALTQVVEFERDGPSSPTSMDSWDDRDDSSCHCCSIQ